METHQALILILNFCLLIILGVLFSCSVNAQTTRPSSSSSTKNTTFKVGVVLDSASLVGRMGLTSLSLALSDFYSQNRNYTTRVVLQVRDSNGSVTNAAASALDLLRNEQVDALIGPQKSAQATFVTGLGDTAKVPIVSFSATNPSLSAQTPYFVQTALNDADQVDAIAAVVNHFQQWHQVVLIYEDSDYGNGIIPYLSNALQQANVRVSYRSVIPLTSSDDFILKELYNMKTMQTRVFIAHVASAFGSRLFPKVKQAGMMSEGYVWIVTSGAMDLFYSLRPNVVESMQGVIGVKPFVPRSRRLARADARWRRKFARDNPGFSPEVKAMSLYSLWAYDTLWAVALAAEKVRFSEPGDVGSLNSTNLFSTGISRTGPKLLDAISGVTFQGLGGNFHLVNGQLQPPSFQILNVVGKSEKEIGLWTPSMKGFSGEKRLGVIMWPGGSNYVPKGWEIPVDGPKLRVGVPFKAGFPEFLKVERDQQTNALTISGYYKESFESVMSALPYAVRYDYIPFETINGANAGTYDDLCLNVSSGEYDAAIGDITITAYRSKFVDFTLPIEAGGVSMIEKIKYDDPTWIFLSPFTKELWLTAIALFILTGIALWILEHRVNRAFRGPPSEHVGLIFYIPFMSLVFAHRERIVGNLARLVIVVWVFVILILSSTYTASLSARLTTLKLQQSEDSNYLNKLIRNGDYVGCRKGSFIHTYLQVLRFNKTLIRTYEKPEEIDVALSNGSGNGGITAFFADTIYADLFLSKYCNKYMKVGSPYLTEGFAFVFPMGSPLVADVSRAIINLTDSGKISKIKEYWIKKTTCNTDASLDPSNGSWRNIGLSSFRVLFAITGGITGTCLVIFFASYLYNNRDYIRRIWNSGATTWSKIHALCRHFDQRDPKSFRTPVRDDRRMESIRGSAVVPVSSDEAGEEDEENRVIENVDRERTEITDDDSDRVHPENVRVA